MLTVLYIVGGGILVGLYTLAYRSSRATQETLEAIREQTEHALQEGHRGGSAPAGSEAGPEESWKARIAELETELAALRREVNDIDEKAEHRFRRLTARAQRAAESEEEEDAELAEIDPETLKAALRAQATGPAGKGAAGGDRNMKRRKRRKKPWLP